MIFRNSGHLIPKIEILSNEIVEFIVPCRISSCESVKHRSVGNDFSNLTCTHGFVVSKWSGMSSLRTGFLLPALCLFSLGLL